MKESAISAPVPCDRANRPYEATPDEEEKLVGEAFAYIQAYGEGWPDAAFAHFKTLSLRARRYEFERWARLMEIMEELGAPKH